jgi:hypothetical protein
MPSNPSDTSFGISISCYRGDLYMLKGLLSSIRQFIPDLPISIIKHGHFPTGRLCDLYSATTIEEADVHPRLREYSYGYGLTKMIAFWHSPFERFLHIDPDAVCWGNILHGLPWTEYDFIYNDPHEVITPSIQREQYFDPDLVLPHYPNFPRGTQPYFNTGVFMARRGIFELDEYLNFLAFQREKPGSFFTDQGILNFMAFSQIAERRLNARAWPFQAVVPVVPAQELRERFRLENRGPVVHQQDRRVIHWAGVKPMLTRPIGFDAPMVHYRLDHLRRTKSPVLLLGRLALALEELHTRLTARHDGNYLRAGMSKARYLIHRTRQRLGLGTPTVRSPIGD